VPDLDSSGIAIDFDVAVEFEIVAVIAAVVAAVVVVGDQYGSPSFVQTALVADMTRAFSLQVG
jgi:hypothetical protein